MKKAFTLIELIISIVIIGLAVSVLPTMIASANKLEEDTINQDVFFKSISVMNDILSRYWDKEQKAQDDAGEGAMVLDVAKGDEKLNRSSSNSQERVGSFGRGEYDFRKFYKNPTLASDIPPNQNTPITSADKIEAIEDYNGRYIDETSSESKVKYDIKVEYVPDTVTTDQTTQYATWNLSGGDAWTSANDSTNIKRITITASGRSANGQPMSVNFVYFSSNIGTPGIKIK